MKTNFTKSLLAAGVLFGSLAAANAQNTVDLTYFSDSTFTSYCPTPALVNFDAWGSASGYDPLLDSMDVYVNFGDGSDTSYMIPIWTNNPPNSSYWTSVQHTYLLAGSYTTQMVITAPDGIADSITHGPVVISNGCADISGDTYIDNNNNCIFDAGDDTLKYVPLNLIDVASGNIIGYTWSNHNGHYNMQVPASVNLELAAPTSGGLTAICPSSASYTFNLAPGATSVYDFGYDCNTSMYDLHTGAFGAGFVPGQEHWMYVHAGNLSCLAESGVVTLTLDPLVSYVPSAFGIAPTSVVGNVLTWNTPSMVNTGVYSSYWSQWSTYLKITTDTTAVVGDTVCHSITVTPNSNDADVSNNTYSYCSPVLASYDPNMKQVSPIGINATGDVDPNTTFTYTVHFQNTGNYPAQNVYILDTISNNLDMTTFEVINASHNMELLDLGNGILKFQFNEIWLADSVSNEPESHGNVTYRIKSKSTLAIGDKVENTAYIFFDYNDPIITNTTLNTIAVVTGIFEPSVLNANLYPNPTSDLLNIAFDEQVEGMLSVRDMTGRLIQTIQINGNKTSVNASDLAKGYYSLDLNGTFVGKFVVK